MTLTNTQRNGLIALIVIVIIIAIVAMFRYIHPGVYWKYKCDMTGDNSRKFYDPNWQARGAVCDGYYIPFGAKLSGANTTRVLEWMSQINNGKPIPTNSKDMIALANQAAQYVNTHP